MLVGPLVQGSEGIGNKGTPGTVEGVLCIRTKSECEGSFGEILGGKGEEVGSFWLSNMSLGGDMKVGRQEKTFRKGRS